MLTYHACSKCDAPVRRSRRRNLLEFLIGPIMLPYRCTICDRREMKLRFIDMEPPPLGEETDLIVTEPTDRELEDVKRAEQKAAEKAAKKAAAKLKKETKAKARSAKTKGAAGAPDSPITPQSHTSDEAEEQISPS
jgi:hypothetical protein